MKDKLSPFLCGFRKQHSSQHGLPGDLEEKNHQDSLWPKRVFVKPPEARTVTMEPLIAVFYPVHKL